MDEDLTPPGPGSFDPGSFDSRSFDPGPAPASGAGGRSTKPDGKGLSIRPGVVVALAVTAALIVFVVQNDQEVPVTWWFVKVNGPLWAVIIVAAVAGALLAEILGWVAGRRRRRRRRRSK